MQLTAVGFLFYITTFANSEYLSPRLEINSDSFGIFKGAILYKNGKQTSCEIALTGISSGFIAASCLDYSKDKALNNSTIYEVHLDKGAPGQPTFNALLRTLDIHVHSNYNPQTMANNIAVIEFNKSIEDTYISIVAFGRSDDMKDVYFRRGYDQEAGDWATPQFYVTSKDAKDCAFYSALYRANNEWMTCISQTAKSVIDNNCIVPFGVDYRLRGNKASLNAIYSHSIIEGNDKCSNKSTRFDYYTRLEPYLGFASKVLNRTLRYSSITGKYSKSTNFTDSMSDPSNPLPEGFTMISGNIYESDSVVRTVGGMHSDLPPLVSTSTKGIVSSTSIQSISTSINLTSDINDKLSTPVNDDTPSNDNITDQSTNYNEYGKHTDKETNTSRDTSLTMTMVSHTGEQNTRQFDDLFNKLSNGGNVFGPQFWTQILLIFFSLRGSMIVRL